MKFKHLWPLIAIPLLFTPVSKAQKDRFIPNTPIYLANHIYNNGPAPTFYADLTGEGKVDVTDVVESLKKRKIPEMASLITKIKNNLVEFNETFPICEDYRVGYQATVKLNDGILGERQVDLQYLYPDSIGAKRMDKNLREKIIINIEDLPVMYPINEQGILVPDRHSKKEFPFELKEWKKMSFGQKAVFWSVLEEIANAELIKYQHKTWYSE